jgi:hypothetical protein
MDTPFEFLRRLDADLADVARADKRRIASIAPTRRGSHWKGVIGAVASLLVIAGVVGLFAGMNGTSQSSMQFHSVGSAVDASAAPPQATVVPGLDQGVTQVPENVKAGELNGYTTGALTESQQKQGAQQAQPADLSKIIRDGQIAVAIADGTFGSSAAKVSHIAAVNGGSVLSSSSTGGESGSFTLRIPAANFERTMAQLALLGTVDSSASHGQDVTAQYVDLKAHMKIYLSRRKVLFGLMADANTIGETLTLQNQLDDVQLKIDQITGQLNYINKQVAESTIKVDLHEPDAAVATTTSDVSKPSLGRAWDHAVQGFLNVLAAVTIGLGYLIPLLVIIGLGYLIVRFVQRRRPGVSDAA